MITKYCFKTKLILIKDENVINSSILGHTFSMVEVRELLNEDLYKLILSSNWDCTKNILVLY